MRFGYECLDGAANLMPVLDSYPLAERGIPSQRGSLGNSRSRQGRGGGGDSQAGRSRQGSGVPMQGDGTFLGWCNSGSAYLGKRSPRVGTHTTFTAIARELGQDGPTLGGNPAGHEYGDDPAGGCRVASYLATSHFAGLPPPFPPPELPSVTFCVADMALQLDVSWLLCASTR